MGALQAEQKRAPSGACFPQWEQNGIFNLCQV
jgi:hypothetical protein